jgi:hypothetical protein
MAHRLHPTTFSILTSNLCHVCTYSTGPAIEPVGYRQGPHFQLVIEAKLFVFHISNQST